MGRVWYSHRTVPYVLKRVKDWWWLLSPRAGHTNCPKNLRMSKSTEMPFHRKALEEHFLMVPLVFWLTHFRTGIATSKLPVVCKCKKLSLLRISKNRCNQSRKQFVSYFQLECFSQIIFYFVNHLCLQNLAKMLIIIIIIIIFIMISPTLFLEAVLFRASRRWHFSALKTIQVLLPMIVAVDSVQAFQLHGDP
jgi:hypothetical protein